MDPIIEKARELGRLIQRDERFIRFMQAENKSNMDEKLQEMIAEFNAKRMELNQEITSDNRDGEKINALNAQVREMYTQIMGREVMLEYQAAKQDMDSLMSFVNQILTGSANGEDPDEIEENAGCTGSCSSCSGCC